MLLVVGASDFAVPATAQTVSGCGTAAIAKTEAGDRAKLAANADCFGKAKTVAAAAEAVRRDRITALPPSPPVFVPTAAKSPSLAGVDPVASGVDIAAYIRPAWGTGGIPEADAAGAEGAFRFLCAPSHLSFDDPVIYPNQPGKSHLHQFFGNTKTNAASTYATLRTSGESTCNNLLNRSAYWIPAMMHPTGKVVQPDWISIYYKRAPSSSIYCRPPYAKACLPLPRGLRYVFGYNMLDASKSDPAESRWWNCDGPGAVAGHFKTITEAAKGCPAGARLGAAVVGPMCWNGRDLDSADHRSHMAYMSFDGLHPNAVCPATHPYLLPFFETIPWYTNDGTAADWRLSSDMPGMAGGSTLHADWFGAWEDSVKDAWTGNCIDKALSCSGGDLGDGRQITPTSGSDIPNGRPLVDVPARPN